MLLADVELAASLRPALAMEGVQVPAQFQAATNLFHFVL